jgi:DNA-binding GntR family transcriptional regulator
LQEYTLEELYYEYRDHTERKLAAEEMAEDAADNIEQKKIDDALAWAEEEEKREAEQEASRISDANQEWMHKMMEEAKQQFGEDFGEDIAEDFSG